MEADHDNHNSNIHINRWDDEEDSTGVEGCNMNNNSMMEKLISSFRGNLSPEVLTFLDAKDVDENDVDEGKRQCLGEQWKEEAQSSLPNYLCPAMMDAKNHAKREEQDHNKKEKWKKETTPQTPHKSRRSKLFLWVGIAFASLTITAVVSVTLVLLKSKSNQNGGSLEDRHTCGGVSVSELKQGRVVMIINETSLENVQTQQRALEETYRMAYNDATGMWSGIDVFERILQSATIDSVEVIRANITRLSWSAVVNCSGCFGYEPLFATETNNSDGKERRDLQLLHQGATGNSIMMRFYEEFNAHLHDTLDDSSPNSKLFYIAAITDTGEPDQYVGMELETPWLELSSPAPSISASTSSNPTSMSTAAIMVLSWVLVNADNDEDIREIFNGDELDLASLPKNLNIRADVTPLTKEVYFYKYDELVEHETKPPYAFASNDARNLSSYKPSSTLKC